MPTITTSQWVSTSPQIRLVCEPADGGNGATTYKVDWKVQYIASSPASTNGVGRKYTAKIDGKTVASGSYNVNGVTGTKTIKSGTATIEKGTSDKSVSVSVSMNFDLTWSGVYCGSRSKSGTISIPKISGYTVTYNANGGSGAPGKQTKTSGVTLKLSTVRPTRSGYTFQGWATSQNGAVAYQPGGNYTANASVTLYAVWAINKKYSIVYNANGGTGAPGSQTKQHGVTLTLSSIRPTREGYNFSGWATTPTGPVAYSAGGQYTGNANLTLYAVWTQGYQSPRITSVSITRCTSSMTPSESGTYARIQFHWETDQNITRCAADWRYNSSSPTTIGSTTFSASGRSGNVSVGIPGFDANTSYYFRIYVSDGKDETVFGVSLASIEYVIDFLRGGTGMAIGKAAENSNELDIYWPVRFRQRLLSAISYSYSPSAWRYSRDSATIKVLNSDGNSTGLLALASIKSINGNWAIGTIGDAFHIGYVTDYSYQNGGNVSHYLTMTADGQIAFDGESLKKTASGTIDHAKNADYAKEAGYATSAGSASNANYASSAGSATTASRATYVTGGFADTYSNTNQMTFKYNGSTYAGFIASEPGGNMTIYNARGLKNIGIYSGDSGRVLWFTTMSGYACLRPPGLSSGILGSSGSYLWANIYTQTVSEGSDLKTKNVLGGIDKAEEFIMGVQPILYTRTDGNSGGKRVHMGFGAQQVNRLIKDIKMGNMSIVAADVNGEKILEDGTTEYDPQYYNGEEIDDENLSWTIRYSEFIAPLVTVVQKQQIRLNLLEKELEQLKEANVHA